MCGGACVRGVRVCVISLVTQDTALINKMLTSL